MYICICPLNIIVCIYLCIQMSNFTELYTYLHQTQTNIFDLIRFQVYFYNTFNMNE